MGISEITQGCKVLWALRKLSYQSKGLQSLIVFISVKAEATQSPSTTRSSKAFPKVGIPSPRGHRLEAMVDRITGRRKGKEKEEMCPLKH